MGGREPGGREDAGRHHQVEAFRPGRVELPGAGRTRSTRPGFENARIRPIPGQDDGGELT